MSRIIDIIRRVVKEEMNLNRGSLLGVISKIFPHEAEDDENNYEVNVRLKHEDLELRKVPLAVERIGIAALPRIGELVLVQFINGDINQPVISGRLYNDQDRPPLHRQDEALFEQRVPDGTLNHLRFTSDGTIYLQRDVTKPEDNSEAKTSIKIDGSSGDIVITAGDNITITVTHDEKIDVVAEGKEINFSCDKMTVSGNAAIEGDLTVGTGPKTTITGNQIIGG